MSEEHYKGRVIEHRDWERTPAELRRQARRMWWTDNWWLVVVPAVIVIGSTIGAFGGLIEILGWRD